MWAKVARINVGVVGFFAGTALLPFCGVNWGCSASGCTTCGVAAQRVALPNIIDPTKKKSPRSYAVLLIAPKPILESTPELESFVA